MDAGYIPLAGGVGIGVVVFIMIFTRLGSARTRSVGTIQVLVERPAGQVFALINNPASFSEWFDTGKAIRADNNSRDGLAAREMLYQIPNECVTCISRTRYLDIYSRFELREERGQTTVNYRETVYVNAGAPLYAAATPTLSRQKMRRRLACLKRTAESQPRAGDGTHFAEVVWKSDTGHLPVGRKHHHNRIKPN